MFARVLRALLALSVLVGASGCLALERAQHEAQYGAAVPAPQFSDDEASDRIIVISQAGEDTWSQKMLRSDQDVFYRLNSDEGGRAVLKAGTATPVGSQAPFVAGDYVSFCSRSGGPGPLITISDRSSGAALHDFRFASLLACPST